MKLNVVIYGRPGCPFCVRAKQFADGISQSNEKFDYEYVDMQEQDIPMEYLCDLAGKPVRTVPQIFINGAHIGGCDDFEKYLIMNDLF